MNRSRCEQLPLEICFFLVYFSYLDSYVYFRASPNFNQENLGLRNGFVLSFFTDDVL